MKLSEYIKGLQDLLKTEGDLDVVYSVDEECNGFHKVGYKPTVFYFEDLGQYYLERIDEDELEDYENPSKAICVN